MVPEAGPGAADENVSMTQPLHSRLPVAMAVLSRTAQDWTPHHVTMSGRGIHETPPPSLKDNWRRGRHFLQWKAIADVLVPGCYLPHMLGPNPLIKLSGPHTHQDTMEVTETYASAQR